VIAVEPLAEMREQLELKAPAAEALAGTAEAIPLPTGSADAVTVGQAFHWFDAERAVEEIGRVLRPEGALALVWNIRDLADTLQGRVNELLLPYRRATPSEHEQPWRAFLVASPLFDAVELQSFPWVQLHTADELTDRIRSVSFVARLEPAEREALLGRVRDAVAGLSEPFEFRYRTDIYVVRRSQVASSQGTPPVSQPTRQ